MSLDGACSWSHFLAMKWPHRIAQGFSPGLVGFRDRPESATELINYGQKYVVKRGRSTPEHYVQPILSAATFRAETLHRFSQG